MLRCCKKINKKTELLKILLKCYELDKENLEICLEIAQEYETVKDI